MRIPRPRPGGAARRDARRLSKELMTHTAAKDMKRMRMHEKIKVAERGKKTSRIVAAGVVGATAFGMYRNRTGPAADKSRGRSTGPYMY